MLENEKIKECFEKLCLDERASQKEVELAYNALTRNRYGDFKGYRLAFEYLMQNVFNAVQTTKEENNSEVEDIIENSPSTVLSSISSLEKKGF